MKIQVPVDASDIDRVMEVEAKPVEIFPWILTVVHRELFGKRWVVAEVTTGTVIDCGDTRKEAVSRAKVKLEFNGEEKTKDMIMKFIKERKQYNF